VRLFATSGGEPRARRATDAVLLVVALIGLGLASAAESPLPGFARAVASFAAAVPNFLDALWQLSLDLLAVLAVGLIVAALVRRRRSVARDMGVAVLLAGCVWLVASRAVAGSWPDVWDALRAAEPPPWYPSARLAIPAAAVITASPHITRPWRRLGRWLMVLAAVGAVVLGTTSPVGAAAGMLVALAAAAATHLVFGSSGGRPSLADVESSLAELGVFVQTVGVAERQLAGTFVVEAVDDHGRDLAVKVYGRDAHDTALAATVWRAVWYREQANQVRFGRLQQVEREALLTLLAAQAGVVTDRVVTAGETESGDALLVLERAGRPLDWDAVDDGTVQAAWSALARMHEAGVVHGQVDREHMVSQGGDVGFVEFRGGTVAPSPTQRRADQAQMFVATVLGVGEERALAGALDALGVQELAAVLPYVQRPALTGDQRARLKDADVDLDGLRERAAAAAGGEAPELEKLRRLSIGAIVSVALPAIALFALVSAAAGIDAEELAQALRDATWWLVALGFVVGQLPRVTQAVSTLGASPIRLPLGPVYALQLTVSYVNLAIPSAAGRIAVNVRFFQRHGVGPGQAVAVGALDGVCGFVVQAFLLVFLLLASPVSLDLQLDSADAGRAIELLLLVVALAVVAVAVMLAVGSWRRAVLGWVRHYVAEALVALRGLRSPRRLAMLLGGNLATELLFAAALATFAAALGFRVGLGEALLINIGVALLAGLLPIPGGIGVSEGGLTFGLVSLGMPEEAAFGAVILYRLATFYLPPVWGFFAMRWLQRNQQL
jgi:uncharacterized membrane protein YbhN (UPF0104 family)